MCFTERPLRANKSSTAMHFTLVRFNVLQLKYCTAVVNHGQPWSLEIFRIGTMEYCAAYLVKERVTCLICVAWNRMSVLLCTNCPAVQCGGVLVAAVTQQLRVCKGGDWGKDKQGADLVIPAWCPGCHLTRVSLASWTTKLVNQFGQLNWHTLVKKMHAVLLENIQPK